jgi:hypothetical protein
MCILSIEDIGEALDVGPGFRRVRITYQYGDGITTIETVRGPDDEDVTGTG